MDTGSAPHSLLAYAWVVILSVWGGIANYMHKVSLHKVPFTLVRLLSEILISAFVGVLTYLLCKAGNIGPLYTAALVGIAGHMGSRAIWRMETASKEWLLGVSEFIVKLVGKGSSDEE